MLGGRSMPTKRLGDVVPCLAVVALSTALGACASAGGMFHEDPKGKAIHIHLKNPPGPQEVAIKKVNPEVKYVCRVNETENCKKTVAWVLKGRFKENKLPANWSVEVRLKEGATRKCFEKDEFQLDQLEAEVDSDEVDGDQCVNFDRWPYDVVLLEGEEPRQTVDPEVRVRYP
jgi:hypothetical protein